MENKNLNVAPTEQELLDAGFKLWRTTYYKQVTTFTSIYVTLRTSKCELLISHHPEEIELTKQKINDVFALFNQPLPQWEQPKPKVGEVWKNKLHRFHIIEGLNGTIWALILEGKDKSKVFDLSMVKYNHTKLADSLEEYYFNK